MCEKCNGTGKNVTQPFPGAYKIQPCQCKSCNIQAVNDHMDKIIKKCEQYAANN